MLKKGFIEIEESLVKTSQRGITTFNVLEHLICDHSFVAYIDKDLMVRDSFIVDFTIELPQFSMDVPSQNSEIPNEKMINLYLLLLNFNADWFAKILRCCFYRTKLVIINSVCGCAAGSARPGVSLALQNNLIPDNYLIRLFFF